MVPAAVAASTRESFFADATYVPIPAITAAPKITVPNAAIIRLFIYAPFLTVDAENSHRNVSLFTGGYTLKLLLQSTK
jgi:hypothetical protein